MFVSFVGVGDDEDENFHCSSSAYMIFSFLSGQSQPHSLTQILCLFWPFLTNVHLPFLTSLFYIVFPRGSIYVSFSYLRYCADVPAKSTILRVHICSVNLMLTPIVPHAEPSITKEEKGQWTKGDDGQMKR